jgi:hypothetical protein
VTPHSGRSDLGRRRGGRPERRRILVVAEGERTERQYLEGLVKHARATGLTVLPVDVHGLGRDPMSVVKKAVHLRDDDRKRRGPRDRYDEVWCVFDVDKHHTLAAAVALAERQSLRVAISNPCFELWLLWHFEDYSKPATAASLKDRLKPRGCANKTIPRGFDYATHTEALRRAASRPALTSQYSVPENPGTSVPALVLAVVRAGR